jgi:hypothetical protein
MRLLLALNVLFCSACEFEDDTGSDGASIGGNDWRVDGLTIGRDGLNYAEVSGTVTLKASYAGLGSVAEVRYYQDQYETLIVKTEQTIGGDLEDQGSTQSFQITQYQVYVTPATGGFQTVCAEFRADDSNYGNWTHVGCL